MGKTKPPSLKFDIDEALHVEIGKCLPWGTKAKVFVTLAKWVCEVRKQDTQGEFIGYIMNQPEPDPGMVVRLGELIRSGARDRRIP
jgi:hypothetical protein